MPSTWQFACLSPLRKFYSGDPQTPPLRRGSDVHHPTPQPTVTLPLPPPPSSPPLPLRHPGESPLRQRSKERRTFDPALLGDATITRRKGGRAGNTNALWTRRGDGVKLLLRRVAVRPACLPMSRRGVGERPVSLIARRGCGARPTSVRRAWSRGARGGGIVSCHRYIALSTPTTPSTTAAGVMVAQRGRGCGARATWRGSRGSAASVRCESPVLLIARRGCGARPTSVRRAWSWGARGGGIASCHREHRARPRRQAGLPLA